MAGLASCEGVPQNIATDSATDWARSGGIVQNRNICTQQFPQTVQRAHLPASAPLMPD